MKSSWDGCKGRYKEVQWNWRLHAGNYSLNDAINKEIVLEKTDDGLEVYPEDPDTQIDQKTFFEKHMKARSTLIQSLADNFLRKVIKEKTAVGMLRLLDGLYSSKTLTSWIHLKHKLFGFGMQSNLSIERNVDEFLKIIANLENAEIVISNEDQAVILLMTLPH